MPGLKLQSVAQGLPARSHISTVELIGSERRLNNDDVGQSSDNDHSQNDQGE